MSRDDIRTMLVAGVIAAAIVLAAVISVHAEEPQKPPARFTCWTVREAVKIYNEADLIAMARAAGISEKEIETAKRCLSQ
jgi:orotate phosphoribosyltransferase